MKIAIVTWFDNINFGTALQVYALSTYIKEKFDAEVDIVNYTPQENDKISKRETISDHLIYRIYKTVRSRFYDSYKVFDKKIQEEYKDELIKRKECFDEFLSRLNFTEKAESKDLLTSLSEEYDLFICGSDQIWNPRILNGVYFLDFVKDKPKISYAASLGINYVPKYAKKYLRSYLKDFRAISLREDTCSKELEKICNKNVEVVCDPSFLLSANEWEILSDDLHIQNDNYFLTYFLGDTKAHRKAFQEAEDITNIKNIVLPSTPFTLDKGERENIAFGPLQFLSLIKGAKFVLTDSFHAVCFSIIFNIPFCVVYKHSKSDPFNQNSRIDFLLKTLSLEERIVKNKDDISKLINTPVDFKSANEKLISFAEKSKAYLDESIF